MSVGINSSKYSVYELWVAGEEYPFYVGKGLKRRPYCHLRLARSGEESYKSRKIRKAWRENLPIIIKHVLRTDIEQEAFNEEKRLIEFYGRKDIGNGSGSLVNHTNGGDGTSGYRGNQAWLGRSHSEETRRKIGDGNRGKVVTEDTRLKMKLAWETRSPASEETRKRMSDSNKGRIVTEETRQKLREINTGRVVTEETRQKLREINTGKHHSEETIQKLRESSTGRHHSEDTCRKISAIHKGKVVTEETRQKLREINTGKHLSEETRLKIQKSCKGKSNGPHSDETKEKMSLSAKARAPISEETRKKMSNSRIGKIRGPYKNKKLEKIAPNSTDNITQEGLS